MLNCKKTKSLRLARQDHKHLAWSSEGFHGLQLAADAGEGQRHRHRVQVHPDRLER